MFNPTPDRSLDAAGVATLPSGEYLLRVSGIKTFKRLKSDDPNVMTFGIQVNVKVAEGEFANKSLFPLKLYYHTDGGQAFAKTQRMAICGYAVESEFNDYASDRDWGFDYDAGSVGDAWTEMVGRQFYATVRLTTDDKDKPKNEIDSLRAV